MFRRSQRPRGSRRLKVSETSPSSRLYVVNFGSNVTVFDASGTSSLAVGTGPGSCRVLRNRIYVANDVGGGVSVIDSNVNDVIETLPTGAGPTMLAAELELVVVGNTGSGSVSIFPEAVSTPAFTISTGADPRDCLHRRRSASALRSESRQQHGVGDRPLRICG